MTVMEKENLEETSWKVFTIDNWKSRVSLRMPWRPIIQIMFIAKRKRVIQS